MWSPDIMSWAYKLKVLGFNEAMKATDDDNLKEELYKDYEKASIRLTTNNAKYNDFCTNNGLKRLSDRVSTAKWNRTEAMKSVKATKLLKMRQESVILKKQKISKDIQNGKYNLFLNVGNQNKHLTSSHSYVESEKKSILFCDLNSAQELINRYHGTGEIRISTKGEWTNKEFIVAKDDIGLVWNGYKYERTNRFAIHYGKKGTHAVPMKREDNNEDSRK